MNGSPPLPPFVSVLFRFILQSTIVILNWMNWYVPTIQNRRTILKEFQHLQIKSYHEIQTKLESRLDYIFDLRVIYIISATKAPKRVPLWSSSFLPFALKAILFLYRLYLKPTDLWYNRLCIYPHTWVVFFQILAIKRTKNSSPSNVSRMYAFSGTHLLILYGPSHVGDHLPNLGSLVPIGKTSFHTKSPWSKDLALTLLSYTLALLASILMRAFSRCPAKSSNSSYINMA